MKPFLRRACGLFVFASAAVLHAQVPQIINYQGRVAVGNTAFDGSGQFKFALVNAAGTTTYWSNNGTSTAGSQPNAAVSLTVTKGLYSVLLGDTTVANMTAVPSTVFSNSDVRLRVWFNDGVNGWQLLTPDQRLAAVGYALAAATLQSGAAISASTLDVSDTARVGPNIASSYPKLIQFGDNAYVSIGENTVDDQMELTGNTFVFKSINGLESGKVGIGVPVPTAKLDVNGTVKATAFSGSGAGLTGVLATVADGSVTSAKLASNLTLGGTTTGTFVGVNTESPANVFPTRGMVWIRPGSFLMGSRTDEPERFATETQHRVTLTKGFWMGVHEVTQAEYLAVMGSNPSYHQPPNATADTSRPVEQVSRSSATAYCTALTTSERTAGRIPATWGYRLPTEAEWEYCCRAGARTTRFSYDDDLNATALVNYAWFYYEGIPVEMTHPVGQKLANPWGLMDMHGNVFEWCQDGWSGSDYPGGSAAVTDPLGSGSSSVVRGGCWGYTAEDARCAARNFGTAAGDMWTGFRAVLAPVP